MAIYHCSIKIISRSQGRSSVASAAYRAGDKIYNEYDGITHDYEKKQGVVYKNIILPENAPEKFQDRATLWNAVEESEKRKNSQTSREIEVALPSELSTEEQAKLIREYVQENFVDRGMCADIAIHDKKDGNPHAHVMLTTREVNQEGFTTKNREWNNKDLLIEWRKQWATKTNQFLETNGIAEKIDHRSYEEQGIEKLPTKHLGPTATAMERRGIETYVGNINRAINEKNRAIEAIDNQIAKLEEELNALKTRENAPVSDSTQKMIYNPIEQAERAYGLKQAYTELAFKREFFQGEKSIIGKKRDSVMSEISDLSQRDEQFKAIDRKINILEQKKLNTKGILKGRERAEIASEIEALSIQRDMAKRALEQKYRIEPARIGAAVAELEAKASEYERKFPAEELNKIQEDMKKASFEYKYIVKSAEFRSDKDEFSKAFGELELANQETPHKYTLKERLLLAEINQELKKPTDEEKDMLRLRLPKAKKHPII